MAICNPVRMAVLSAIAAAFAGAAAAEDLTGKWQFKTNKIDNRNCVISGDVTFKKAKAPLAYTCEFTSLEMCSVDKHMHKVKQSCEVTEKKGEIALVSTVIAILDAGPPEQKQYLMTPGIYAPDSFTVKPTKPGEMAGTFYSTSSRAPVRFWRLKPGPTS